MIIFPATSLITSDCQPNQQYDFYFYLNRVFFLSDSAVVQHTRNTTDPNFSSFMIDTIRRSPPQSHKQVHFTSQQDHTAVQHIFPYNTQLTLGRWKSKKISSSYVRRLSNHQEWTSRCWCLDRFVPAWVIPLLHWMCPSLWDLVTPFRQDNNGPTELGPLSSQLNRFSDESSVLVRNYSILTCCLISTITGWFSIKFNWIAATGLRFPSTVRTRTTLDTEWFIRLIVIGYCALPIKWIINYDAQRLSITLWRHE